MFRPGRWATAFLFIYLHYFNANGATSVCKNGDENKMDVVNCNWATRKLLSQTYEIFEPRDWIKELKYLENAVTNDFAHELTSDKRTILEETQCCRTCLNTPNTATYNGLFCNKYCGLEIYNLKNKTNIEIKPINLIFPIELKNKSANSGSNAFNVLMAINTIKNKSSTEAMLATITRMKISMISNHTEVFNDIVQLNRSRATESTMMIYFKDIINANTKKWNMCKANREGNNKFINAVIAHNKTRAIDTANWSKTNHFVNNWNQRKNKTISSALGNKNMAHEMSVANWLMAKPKAKNENPTTFNKIVDNLVTPCAAMFMYAMTNPLVCNKL